MDLQVMFTQVDKVGKAQLAQQDGQTLSKAIQGANIQRKAEEQVKEVNQAQDFGEGVEKLNEKGGGQRKGGGAAGKGSQEDGEGEAAGNANAVFNDPLLGKNIDVSF